MTNNSGSSETSKTIGDLDTLRRKHGGNSDIGGICSNLIEQLKTMQKEPEAAARLAPFIADQQAHLAQLLRVEQRNRQAGEG